MVALKFVMPESLGGLDLQVARSCCPARCPFHLFSNEFDYPPLVCVILPSSIFYPSYFYPPSLSYLSSVVCPSLFLDPTLVHLSPYTAYRSRCLNMSSGNRHTQINFLKASAEKLSPQHPEASAVLPALLSSLVGGTLESTTKKLISKRSRSPTDDTDHTRSVKIPRLPSISESGTSSFTNIIARHESPWETYKKHFNLDLNGPVTVAQGKAGLVPRRRFICMDAYDIPTLSRLLTPSLPRHRFTLSSSICPSPFTRS
jgi:hypothetical protein